LRLGEAPVLLAPVIVRQRRDPIAGHPARQQPGSHRRVDDHADPLAFGERQDLALGLARDERVLRLERLDRRELLDATKLRDVEVRDADVSDEALLLELRQSGPALLDVLSGMGQWIW
jgi:hypothetical protein